ncbi:GPI transamidase component [Dipsacomyces acuminosporus]|nr:GPI transamidase component [Dipsacomyces acuminosporus]
MSIIDKVRSLIKRPSERKATVSVRSDRRVVVASILVIFLLGLPLWWTTTRVYRADLPNEAINKYTPRNALVIPFTFYLNSVQQQALSSQLAKSIGRQVQQELDKQRPPYLLDEWRIKYTVRVATGKAPDIPGHYTVNLAAADIGTAIDFGADRSMQITVPKMSQTEKTVVFWLTKILITEEHHVRMGLHQSTTTAAKNRRNEAVSAALKYSPEYAITFTLLNENPVGGVSTDWDIESAISHYLQPFVDRLSPLTKLSVSSQILHHAGPPPINPLKTVNGTVLTPNMLSHFANSPSWNLASTDPVSPMLNFILYVPELSSQPMQVLDSENRPVQTNAFLVPQWGGIIISNLHLEHRQNPSADNAVYSQKEMQQYMGIFIAQLRRLIGIRGDIPVKHATHHAGELQPKVSIRRATKTGISDWEFDALSRQWLIHNRQNAIATLQSLTRLVDSMQNMVVMDDIKTQVDQSLDALEAIENVLRGGERSHTPTDHLAASKLAAAASAFAEGAFFDPSMVSLLYFPDQHKYAIYLPFFLPVAIPLLHAIRKIVKEAKAQAKEQEPNECSTHAGIADKKND